jgi:hypothetical protein
MDLFSLALLIVGIGVLLWAANTFIPMADSIKKILNLTVVVALVLYLLKLFVPAVNIPVGR